MKLRYEKNVRVLTDLMGYCHHVGANDFHIDFSMRGPLSVIKVAACVENLPQRDLEMLNHTLSMPRQREVEQYYWNISGEEEIDDELSLAAMMVDRSAVAYDGTTLTICCERDDTPGE